MHSDDARAEKGDRRKSRGDKEKDVPLSSTQSRCKNLFGIRLKQRPERRDRKIIKIVIHFLELMRRRGQAG